MTMPTSVVVATEALNYPSTLLQDTLVDAKGDLIAGTAADAVSRLAVGTNGHVLKAASGQATGLQWAAATDLATVPTSDGATAVVGTSLSAAPADHAHGRYNFGPADYAWKAWSFDVALVGAGSTPTDGVLQLALVHLPVAASITNVLLVVTTAGSSLTASNNIAGLWTAAGVKVGVTADQSGSWNSGGLKTMALTGGPFACAAGDYYVGWWLNGSGTDPAFGRQGSVAAVNGGLAAPNLRFATADGSLTNAASAPGPFGAQTAASIGWWAGLS